jgi:ATP-dependent Clp endopeptidase proteolytic subunit ClpP
MPKSPAQVSAKAQIAAAQIAKFEAETRKLDVEAAAADLELQKALRAENAQLATEHQFRVYHFNGSVGEASVIKCIDTLASWSRQDPGCAIEIIFDSPGGSVIDGLALFDYIRLIRSRGHHVTTGAIGYAASMAGILLQAGDTRWIGQESWLMIHEASFGASGKTGDVADRVEWIKRVQQRFLKIFADRSKMTIKQIDAKWARQDWWLDSGEALKLGFVDEVR